jgi:hypothetical protein
MILVIPRAQCGVVHRRKQYGRGTLSPRRRPAITIREHVKDLDRPVTGLVNRPFESDEIRIAGPVV